ncbi:Nudix hydrolase chloroplastic [Hyphodiscus hymeniophilus]|uniref:Nudix hydrolase chloroplastic n=1 Tax=Hyphodiscus hymeniophilus TaxID=353542 RepID=A0A9P7AVX5_9HELO|nr:Nudix hydrolase chloroplastic [Hyphodiscus hymeniophilus]
MKSNLDIVKECDNFPYYAPGNSEDYEQLLSSLWLFFLPDDPMPHGFIVDSVARKMPWTTDFKVIPSPRKEVHLLRSNKDDWQEHRTQAIDSLLDEAIAKKVFSGLNRKRGELWPIVGAEFDVHIDRAAISYLGIIGRGVHMTAYTRSPTGFKFWIPQRNLNKKTYPGMLDNTVAGGVASGETPFSCLIREAAEEAEVAELVRAGAGAAGTVSWLNISDEKAGGDAGLMNPGVLYVYDLEVSDNLVLKPVDNDIHAFHLLSEVEVSEAMARGEFKPACACVILDFFVRHSLISPDTEKDYVEIVSRLHRKLPFDTSH